MKTFIVALSMVLIAIGGLSQEIKPGAEIIVNDKLIQEVIPANARIEILAGGFEWTEGPLWLPGEEKLIFSDIPKNSIFEWTEKGGKKLYLSPSGYTGDEKRGGEAGSNGLLLSPKGDLVLCMHGDRRVARMLAPVSAPEPKYETLVDSYNGKKLNSPNDAVYNNGGELFFTDPPYGLESGTDDPGKELDFQGVYKVGKDGTTTLLTAGLSRPNGIAFSPDERKLYVANSDPEEAIWMVYDVSQNGTLSEGEVFYDVSEWVLEYKGLPDGMKVHPNGWIFATGPGGVLVFTPEGDHLGTIFTGEATSNCAFNEDYTELYMTADNYLLRVKLNPVTR